MKVRHMVVVKIENCNPQRSDEIVRACLRQWKGKAPRDEMVRIDRGSASDPISRITISTWINLPGDFSHGMAGDFDIRLARAVWKTNGGYCFVQVLAKFVHLLAEDYSFFWEENYEEMLGTKRGRHEEIRDTSAPVGNLMNTPHIPLTH